MLWFQQRQQQTTTNKQQTNNKQQQTNNKQQQNLPSLHLLPAPILPHLLHLCSFLKIIFEQPIECEVQFLCRLECIHCLPIRTNLVGCPTNDSTYRSSFFFAIYWLRLGAKGQQSHDLVPIPCLATLQSPGAILTNGRRCSCSSDVPVWTPCLEWNWPTWFFG